jgi:hypothetical protein
MKSQEFEGYYKTPGTLALNFASKTACEDRVSHVTSTELIKSKLFTSQHDATIHKI